MTSRNNPTSREECEELCRLLGIDPKEHWGTINDFACDCFYAGQQDEKRRQAAKEDQS